MATSTYKPEYCDQIADFMATGHSIEAFASEIKVSRQTIYNWKEKFPEFAEAMERGDGLRKKFLESAMVKLGLTGVGNASTLIFLAKNWCGMRDDYGHDHTSGGEKMKTIGIILDKFESNGKENRPEIAK